MVDAVVIPGTPGPGAAAPAPGAGVPGPGAAAPTPGAAAPGATIIGADGKSAAAAAAAVTPSFGEKWREELSGGDAKELERLKRFASPADIWKMAREAEAKITSGQLKTTMTPEELAKATPEQLATYRKENGIPETPDKYELKLSNGVVVGEADKPIVDKFLGAMHAANMPPAAVNTALDTYYKIVAEQDAAKAAADATHHDTSLLALGKEYGADLGKLTSGVSNMIGQHFPADMATALLAARMPDGRLLANHPGVIKGFISLMRDAMPGATLVPAGSSNIGKSVTDRMSELKGMMGDPSSKYWKGDDAAKFQQEYRDLITADQKMKERA